MRSRVSLGVAICALDEERELPRVLARLAEGPEDDRADRVVVADGGSRDRTCAIARASGAELVECARGRGRQLALAASRLDTEVLIFVHADCRPSKGSLAVLRAAFRDPALRACGVRQSIEARGLFYRAVERAADLRVRLFGTVYGDSMLCVRREDYLAVGGFRELALFEDLDLSRRLRGARRARWVGAAAVHVSPRRWRREGAWRATLRNWLLLGAYTAGVSPERLVRFYAPHSESS